MNAFFSRVFTWATAWWLVQRLAAVVAIYMVCCFAWPLLNRAADTTGYAVFQLPADAGNWVADKIGLKPGAAAKPPAPADPAKRAFGGPPAEELPSVEHARRQRERLLQSQELALQSDIEGVSADAAARREAGIRQLYTKLAQPGDCLQVGVLDRKTGKPVEVDTNLYLETSTNTLVETVRAGLGKELPAVRGVSYRLYARIPGGKTSTRAEVPYSTSDTGPKPVILYID